MNLEQTVRLVISLQIILATGLLSLGEASAWLPLATVAVLAVSAYVTDLKGWFFLKQPAADLLALVVVILSAIGTLQTDRQGLLIVVANLQSYLQYVVLFQRKTPRVYWQLALLSLGQMAISSTLLPSMTFGFALLGYLLLATLGFSLLLLRTEGAGVAADAAYQAAFATIDKCPTRGPILRGAAAPNISAPMPRSPCSSRARTLARSAAKKFPPTPSSALAMSSRFACFSSPRTTTSLSGNSGERSSSCSATSTIRAATRLGNRHQARSQQRRLEMGVAQLPYGNEVNIKRQSRGSSLVPEQQVHHGLAPSRWAGSSRARDVCIKQISQLCLRRRPHPRSIVAPL